jgi:pyruvate dehydrogenase E1 component alpha subunit
MWRAAHTAVERARRGEGPTLIEARTFRFEGHIMGDDGTYIPKAEMQAALDKDPVPALRGRLLVDGAATEVVLSLMEAAIDAEIAEAEAYALAEPYPDVSELGRDVFAEEIVP